MTPAPTPQPAHDHGSAGFCTDHGQVPDERTETVAGVVEAACRSLMGGDGRFRGDLRTIVDTIAAAVVAALDDETARLRAEVEKWREAHAAAMELWHRTGEGWTKTAADLAAARAALDRARADAWDEGFDAGEPVRDDYSPTNPYRAALAAVADAPGLEEVLVETLRESLGVRWSDDPEAYREALGKRLADMVRAWLRSEGT